MTFFFMRLSAAARLFGQTFHATLREIFDEAAYERFLKARGLANSRSSYGLYLRESDVERQRRPRCC